MEQRSFGSSIWLPRPPASVSTFATSSAASSAAGTLRSSGRKTGPPRSCSPLPLPGIVFGRVNYAKVLRPSLQTSYYARSRRPYQHNKPGPGQPTKHNLGGGCPFKERREPSASSTAAVPPVHQEVAPPPAQTDVEDPQDQQPRAILASIVSLKVPLIVAGEASAGCVQRARAQTRRTPKLHTARHSTPPDERLCDSDNTSGYDGWTTGSAFSSSASVGCSGLSSGGGGGGGRFRMLRSLFRRVRRRSRSTGGRVHGRSDEFNRCQSYSRPRLSRPSLSPSLPPTPPPTEDDDSDGDSTKLSFPTEGLASGEDDFTAATEVVLATFPGHPRQKQALAFLASLLGSPDAASAASSVSTAASQKPMPASSQPTDPPRAASPPVPPNSSNRSSTPKRQAQQNQKQQPRQQQCRPIRRVKCQKVCASVPPSELPRKPSNPAPATSVPSAASITRPSQQRKPRRIPSPTPPLIPPKLPPQPAPAPPEAPLSIAEIRRRRQAKRMRRLELALQGLSASEDKEVLATGPQSPRPPILQSLGVEIGGNSHASDDKIYTIEAAGTLASANAIPTEEENELIPPYCELESGDGDSIVSFIPFVASEAATNRSSSINRLPPLPPPSEFLVEQSVQTESAGFGNGDALEKYETLSKVCDDRISSSSVSAGTASSLEQESYNKDTIKHSDARKVGKTKVRPRDSSSSDEEDKSNSLERCSDAIEPIRLTFHWDTAAPRSSDSDSYSRESTDDSGDKQQFDSRTTHSVASQQQIRQHPQDLQHPQQTHPQQTHPQQTHLQQTHPQQTHPQQTHPQQTHPQQTHPQQQQDSQFSDSAASAAVELLARLSALRRRAPAGMEAAMRAELEALARIVGSPLSPFSSYASSLSTSPSVSTENGKSDDVTADEMLLGDDEEEEAWDDEAAMSDELGLSQLQELMDIYRQTEEERREIKEYHMAQRSQIIFRPLLTGIPELPELAYESSSCSSTSSSSSSLVGPTDDADVSDLSLTSQERLNSASPELQATSSLDTEIQHLLRLIPSPAALEKGPIPVHGSSHKGTKSSRSTKQFSQPGRPHQTSLPARPPAQPSAHSAKVQLRQTSHRRKDRASSFSSSSSSSLGLDSTGSKDAGSRGSQLSFVLSSPEDAESAEYDGGPRGRAWKS